MKNILNLFAHSKSEVVDNKIYKPGDHHSLGEFPNKLLTVKLTAFSAIMWVKEGDYTQALKKLDWVDSQWKHVRYDWGEEFSDEGSRDIADVAAAVLLNARSGLKVENLAYAIQDLYFFIEILDKLLYAQRVSETEYYSPVDYEEVFGGEEEECFLDPIDSLTVEERRSPLACTLEGKKTPEEIPEPPRFPSH